MFWKRIWNVSHVPVIHVYLEIINYNHKHPICNQELWEMLYDSRFKHRFLSFYQKKGNILFSFLHSTLHFTKERIRIAYPINGYVLFVIVVPLHFRQITGSIVKQGSCIKKREFIQEIEGPKKIRNKGSWVLCEN